jgi:tetratricopeptide (TPR) repeat protein
MYSITQQNNDAAVLIESGLYREALSKLSRALSQVQRELNDADELNEEEQDVGSADGYIINTCHEHERQAMSTCLVEKLEPNQDFIYRHPIKTSDIPKQEESYVMSVILVFNMALAHHLIGISQDDDESSNGKKRLRGALKLYELVFGMQMKSHVYISMTCSLALVNNSAQIYKAINRERKAQKYFSHLLSSLMIMVEKGEANNLDELEGFLWNASRLILTQPAAPAA